MRPTKNEFEPCFSLRVRSNPLQFSLIPGTSAFPSAHDASSSSIGLQSEGARLACPRKVAEARTKTAPSMLGHRILGAPLRLLIPALRRRALTGQLECAREHHSDHGSLISASTSLHLQQWPSLQRLCDPCTSHEHLSHGIRDSAPCIDHLAEKGRGLWGTLAVEREPSRYAASVPSTPSSSASASSSRPPRVSPKQTRLGARVSPSLHTLPRRLQAVEGNECLYLASTASVVART